MADAGRLDPHQDVSFAHGRGRHLSHLKGLPYLDQLDGFHKLPPLEFR
jgi:hypothetical protein